MDWRQLWKTRHRKIWLANALLRPCFWHCIGIPIVASVLMIVHFWRVRKDGGISGPESGVLASEGKPPRGPRHA